MKRRTLLTIGLLVLGTFAGSRATGEVADKDEDKEPGAQGYWSGKKALNISDCKCSFGLDEALKQGLEAAGAELRVERRLRAKAASWTESGRLKRLLKKHDPDAVIVTLDLRKTSCGTPAECEGAVRKIDGLMGDRKCYWVGPPISMGGDGAHEILSSSLEACTYLSPFEHSGNLPPLLGLPETVLDRLRQKAWRESITETICRR